MKTERLRRIAQQIVEERLYYPLDRIDMGEPLRDIPWYMAWRRSFRVKYILAPARRARPKRLAIATERAHKEYLAFKAKEAEQVAEIQADVDAGKYSIVGDWIMFDAGKCTCGSPLGSYPHEPYCGIEPVAKVVDVVRGVWSV